MSDDRKGGDGFILLAAVLLCVLAVAYGLAVGFACGYSARGIECVVSYLGRLASFHRALWG
jgi:hypothetical protein